MQRRLAGWSLSLSLLRLLAGCCSSGLPLIRPVVRTAATSRASRRGRLQSAGGAGEIFAAGETLALGVLKEARTRQLHVHQELAIIGYTDSPAAGRVAPPLTMVSVPAREIGVRAMRSLFDLMRGKKPRPRRTVLDVELVLRDSCGTHQRDARHHRRGRT